MPIEEYFDRGCRMCMQPIKPGEPRIKEPDRALVHGRKDLVHLLCALRTMPFHVERMLPSLDGGGLDCTTITRIISLWREVIAAPDDDGPRLVLADALHEIGDPRAELITLQLIGSERGDTAERIAALLEANGDTWLWKLYALVRVARFERGFLARVELSERSHRIDDHDAALGTVVDLLPGGASGELYAKLVTSPAMASLRRIQVWDDDSLTAFERTSAQLVGVGCGLRLDTGWHAGLANLGERFLRAAGRCETLRELAIDFGSFERVASSACFRRLARLAIANHRDALALWYRIPPGMMLAVVDAATLPPIDEPGSELSLVRTGARVTARASGAWVNDCIFDRLPEGVTHVVVEDAHDELANKLRALAGARKIELAVVETEPPTAIWRSGWI